MIFWIGVIAFSSIRFYIIYFHSFVLSLWTSPNQCHGFTKLSLSSCFFPLSKGPPERSSTLPLSPDVGHKNTFGMLSRKTITCFPHFPKCHKQSTGFFFDFGDGGERRVRRSFTVHIVWPERAVAILMTRIKSKKKKTQTLAWHLQYYLNKYNGFTYVHIEETKS